MTIPWSLCSNRWWRYHGVFAPTEVILCLMTLPWSLCSNRGHSLSDVDTMESLLQQWSFSVWCWYHGVFAPTEVRAVKLATSRLEQLHPEVIPAIGAVARHPGNVAAVRHLKGLVQEWGNETEALVRALDSMTDPAVFLHVTGQCCCYSLSLCACVHCMCVCTCSFVVYLCVCVVCICVVCMYVWDLCVCVFATCVCVCVSVSVSVHVWDLCVCVWDLCVRVCECVCVCACVRPVCVCVCVCARTHTYMHAGVCVCVRVCKIAFSLGMLLFILWPCWKFQSSACGRVWT